MDLAAPEWKYLTKTATTTSERNDSIFFSSWVSSTKQRDCYWHARLAPGLSPRYRPKVRMTDISAPHVLCW